MNIKRCETIPYKNFNERLRLTKEFLKQGIIPQDLQIQNCLFVDYTMKRRLKHGTT